MPAPPVAICPPQAAAQRENGDIPVARIPRLPASAADAKGFVMPGWRIEKQLSADLDRDGRADLVAVLKGADPACRIATDEGREPFDSNPRILMVALARGGRLMLQAANSEILTRRSDPYMDDPFEAGDLTVRNGAVRVGLTSWRSAGGWSTFTAHFTFRWDGRVMALIGYDRDHLQRNSGETEQISVNFPTRRARIVTGSMEDDVPERTVWKTVPTQPAAALQTLGDGLDYEPRR